MAGLLVRDIRHPERSEGWGTAYIITARVAGSTESFTTFVPSRGFTRELTRRTHRTCHRERNERVARMQSKDLRGISLPLRRFLYTIRNIRTQ